MNTKCSNGNTPVHMAFKSGHRELIHFMFRQGADLNVVNNDNMTPICFGSYGLLRELNLMNGFAILNEEEIQKEVGKQQKREKSIIDFKKNSLVLDKKIRDFLKKKMKQRPKSDFKLSFPVKIESEEEKTEKALEKQHEGSQSMPSSALQLGPKPKRMKFFSKKGSQLGNGELFKSNNLNYRLRKGKTIQAKSRKGKLKKKFSEDQRTLEKQKPKLTFKEMRFNKMVEERKKRKKEKEDFSNDFIEDTCGAEVFLMKKLPKMYDPSIPNEIVFQLNDLENDVFLRNQQLKSIKQSIK